MKTLKEIIEDTQPCCGWNLNDKPVMVYYSEEDLINVANATIEAIVPKKKDYSMQAHRMWLKGHDAVHKEIANNIKEFRGEQECCSPPLKDDRAKMCRKCGKVCEG